MAGEVDEIAGRGQNALAPPRHFLAQLGELDRAGTPFHQYGVEFAFQLAHLHGQGRLGHRAGLGGAAEMAMAREGFEVAQLAQTIAIR